MKQTLLVVFLLGFGYFAPWSCSKKQASDENKTAQPAHKRPCDSKKQMVLFGPVNTIRPGQKA